jgi:hypothetical protein
LARARSLRARFERWEAEENAKNEERSGCAASAASGLDSAVDSLESARELKARFEMMQQQQQQQQAEKKSAVDKARAPRRFVVSQQQHPFFHFSMGQCESLSDYAGF